MRDDEGKVRASSLPPAHESQQPEPRRRVRAALPHNRHLLSTLTHTPPAPYPLFLVQGFGFVNFEAPEQAAAAVAALNGACPPPWPPLLAPGGGRPLAPAPWGQGSPLCTASLARGQLPVLCSWRACCGRLPPGLVRPPPNRSNKRCFFPRLPTPTSTTEHPHTHAGKDVKGKDLYVGRAQKKAEREAMLRAK